MLRDHNHNNNNDHHEPKHNGESHFSFELRQLSAPSVHYLHIADVTLAGPQCTVVVALNLPWPDGHLE